MTDPAISSSLLQQLRNVPFLGALPPDELAALAALMTTRRAKAGETLITEGEPGDEMFLLLHGQVRVSRRTLDNDPFTVAVHEDDHTPFFGELALLDPERRAVSIQTTRNSELLVLTRAAFERFGDEHPRAGLLLMRLLARRSSERLRRANEDAVLLFEALVNEVRTRTAV